MNIIIIIFFACVLTVIVFGVSKLLLEILWFLETEFGDWAANLFIFLICVIGFSVMIQGVIK